MSGLAAAGVTVVGEGVVDVAAARRVLDARGLVMARGIVSTGKIKFDSRIRGYNSAAARGAWLCLRDSDRDHGDCAVALLHQLLPSPQPGMCLRLAVRSLEAWLLADPGLSAHLRVRDVADADELADAKRSLVNLCRRSTSTTVRKQMVPRPQSGSAVGPEYTSVLLDFVTATWDVARAAQRSPSLTRALRAIDQRVAAGVW